MRHRIVPRIGFSALLTSGLAALTIAGCGGGSNGSHGGGTSGPGGTTLTGDLATQAALVSSYQAFQGGVNYPFAQVQATLPNGSAFKAALRAAVAAALQKRAVAHGQTAHSGPSPDGIGLYSETSTSGNTETITEYADAAETQSEGTLTVTQTAPAVTTINLGTYTTYPEAFAITADLTAGPLPCTGNGTIALNDSAGAGTIQGTFTLPATHVTASADLTLNDSGDIGGSLTVTENGQTITLTNLSGTISGPITGAVSVAPQGYTGRATLSIADDTFNVTLNTPSGTATGSVNGSGSLVISYPDGTSETFTNPLTTSPTAPISASGGTGGGGTTGTLPLDVAQLFPFADWQPSVSNSIPFNVLINNSNQVLEQNSNTQLIYLPSANTLGTSSLITSPNSDPIALAAFNNAGEFVANNQANTAIYVWAGPTATPTTLALPFSDGVGSASPTGTASALSSNGEIVGNASLTSSGTDTATNNGQVSGLGDEGVAWASASATPTLLVGLNNSVTTVNGYTFTVFGANVLVSGPSGADTYTLGAVASPVTAGKASIPLYDPSGTNTLTGTNTVTFTATQAGNSVASFSVTLTVGDAFTQASGVNASGLIVGTDNASTNQSVILKPVYWTGGSSTAHALSAPSGADGTAFSDQGLGTNVPVLGVNNSGQIYGDTSSGHVYFWSSVTAQPVELPLLPGGSSATAFAINAAGTVAGLAVDSGGQYHAVIWKNGQIIDLQPYGVPQTTVGGTIYNTLLSQANSLNDSGIVVGFADITPFALRTQ